MDSNFQEIAVPWILDAEGGFVNDASDRGGATKYGISLRYLKNVPDHDGDGFLGGDYDQDGDVDVDDIRAMRTEDAIERYYQDFWLAGRCHDMPPAVGLCLFDALVNHRPKTAKIILQRGLRVVADGIVGPMTLAAANNTTVDSIFDDFLPDYFSYRTQLYHDIVLANSSQAKFLRGWHRRMFLLQSYLLRYAA